MDTCQAAGAADKSGIPVISFFFNRSSRAVLAVEIAGVALLPLTAIACIIRDAGFLASASLIAIALMYLFIRACASVRWYRGAPRYSGVELQFKKALVPTSYAMAISELLYLALSLPAILVVAAALILVVAHVNVILVYFHRRDHDPTPVNYYSSGRFLRDSEK
jgi:hypothetical protein